VVREIGRGGRVNEVEVQNRSRRPVFLMGGQMLFGSKQDRIFQRDALISPRSEWTRVPVYCVERDRWTPVSEHFSGKGRAVAPALRRAAQESASQAEIWSGVARQRDELGVAKGGTETYGAIYEDAGIQSRLREYRDRLRPTPGWGTCGVVAVGRRGIICADIFGDRALFAKLWDSLLDSYVLDEGKHGRWPITEEGAVREFLRQARSDRAGHYDTPTPGIGDAMRISGMTSGAALSYRHDAVHVNLYPRPVIRPLLER
ncbi:MAG: ARPP-1 family domain-containing protein, partial [Armatimonadota bacterium]